MLTNEMNTKKYFIKIVFSGIIKIVFVRINSLLTDREFIFVVKKNNYFFRGYVGRGLASRLLFADLFSPLINNVNPLSFLA